MPYWIQSADLSAVDYSPVDMAAAIRAFRDHDWDEELRLLKDLESRGEDCCLSGIGFVDPDGPILHVCPSRDGCAMVHYHANGTHKVFGIIPTLQPMVHTREEVDRAEVLHLIQLFFEGRHDWVVARLSAA